MANYKSAQGKKNYRYKASYVFVCFLRIMEISGPTR